MSWTDYCNQLVGDGKTVAHCAFFAHQANVLGYSPSFYAACAQIPNFDYAAEVNNLNAALGDPSQAQSNGIKVGGLKFMYIRSHKDENAPNQFLVGNKGGAGVSVRKTKSGVLIGISAAGASAPCDLAMYKAAEALIKANA